MSQHEAHLKEHDFKKQTQFTGVLMNASGFSQRGYENQPVWRLRENKANQSQFVYLTAENTELAKFALAVM
jgi:hypothetical protein